MSNPWDPERVVAADLARSLIDAQFGDLAPARVELLGVGWDNTAFLVNDDLVFRFPRRTIAVDLIRTEMAALPRLAARVPVPVPVPAWDGKPTARFPWPFAGYRRLPGLTACSIPLSDRDRARLAEPLAEFLAALHATPLDEAQAWGVGPDTIGRLDPARLGDQIRRTLADMHGCGAIADPSTWLPIAEAARARTPPRLHVLHGDLYARHLLVDGARRLCGVIDFGDLHYGDPAVDLSIAWTFLPPEARARFFAIYGAVDAGTLALARLRGLMSATAVWAYGRDRGDNALVSEGIRALHCVAAT